MNAVRVISSKKKEARIMSHVQSADRPLTFYGSLLDLPTANSKHRSLCGDTLTGPSVLLGEPIPELLRRLNELRSGQLENTVSMLENLIRSIVAERTKENL